MIQKDLNLTDLMEISLTHPRNCAVAEMTFRDKFGHLVFEIKPPYLPGLNEKVSLAREMMTIRDMNIALKLLKIFGKLIPRIKVHYDHIQPVDRELLNNHIQIYCANSVRELELEFFNANELKQLKGPFPKAESVSLESGTLETNGLQLNVMFPAVRHFSTKYVTYSDPKCIGQHFPNLQHLSLGLLAKNMPAIEELIAKNPQLTEVKASCDMDFVKMLNDKIPTLEILTLLFTSETSNYKGTLAFNHLKQLTIYGTPKEELVERFPFDVSSLEELSFPAVVNNALFDVIRQNKHLKQLSVKQLRNDQLEQIPNALPMLEVLIVEHSENIMDNIVKFLKSAINLKAFMFPAEAVYCDLVAKELNSEWQKTFTAKKCILTKNWGF